MKYYIINCYASYVVQPFLVVVERIIINYGPEWDYHSIYWQHEEGISNVTVIIPEKGQDLVTFLAKVVVGRTGTRLRSTFDPYVFLSIKELINMKSRRSIKVGKTNFILHIFGMVSIFVWLCQKSVIRNQKLA